MRTYQVSDKQPSGVKVGNFVKIGYKGERFWVKVVKITRSKRSRSMDHFIGIVDNRPITPEIKYKDKLTFYRKNIFMKTD